MAPRILALNWKLRGMAGTSPRSTAELHNRVKHLSAGDLPDELSVLHHWATTFVFAQHVLGDIHNVFIGVSHYQVVGCHMIAHEANLLSL